MKRIIWFIIVLVAGYLIYNHFSGRELSKQEKEIMDLERDFKVAQKRFLQAGRMSGLGALDSSSEMEDAIAFVLKIKENLVLLMDKLTEEGALKRAERLNEKINLFLRESGYK